MKCYQVRFIISPSKCYCMNVHAVVLLLGSHGILKRFPLKPFFFKATYNTTLILHIAGGLKIKVIKVKHVKLYSQSTG